jgi:hypothetical protein
MKEEQDYIQDIAEIRSMMERSSKFLSLSGWAGIMAGIYALSGAGIVYKFFHFNPDEIVYGNAIPDGPSANLQAVVFTAIVVLILAIATAVFLSWRKADEGGNKLWNAATRQLLTDMAVPLIIGGVVVVILISKGLIGLLAPFTLLFYGMALYNAGKFTYKEVKNLGLIQVALGLVSSCFIEYGLLCWALGFGVVHIVYGIYIHYKYER